LALASDWQTNAVIGKRTGFHAETVRRYMESGRVPAKFLAAFCLAFDVNPQWMLLGKGGMRQR
jgi:hypothetical protein